VAMHHPTFRKPSTPRVGTSTHLKVGTPSDLRLSIKLLHSATINPHSAKARPAYLDLAIRSCLFVWLSMAASGSFGSRGKISRLIPGTRAPSHAWAAAGNLGGDKRLSGPTLDPDLPLVPGMFPFGECWGCGFSKC